MPGIIGIDLGTHTIKCVLMDGAFGRYQITDYRLRSVNHKEGEPPGLAEQLQALSDLLEEISLDNPQHIAGWPADFASVRLVTLPFGDRTQVEKTLPFEVEAQVPFDLDSMVLTSRVLKIEPGNSQVLCSLVDREQIRNHLNALQEIGVDPRNLLLDGDALGHFSDDGIQAIIDIGHTRTLITLCRDGRSIMTRAINGGGRDLTLALAKKLDISFGDAEGRKHIVQLKPSQEPVLVEASWDDDEVTHPGNEILHPGDAAIVREALAPIMSGIRSTLLAFEDQYQLEIDAVLLCGGTAELGGLRDHFRQDLGVPVQRIKVRDENSGAESDVRYALVHALGMTGMGTIKDAMDMRQNELAFHGDLAFVGRLIRIGVIAAAIMLSVGVGYSAFQYTSLSSELHTLDQQIVDVVKEALPSQVDPNRDLSPSEALSIMQTNSLMATSRVDTLGSIVSDVPPTLNLLRELSEGMPPPNEVRIDATELNITENSITLKAETDGFEEASRIESSLQTRDLFENAQKGDEKKNNDGSVRFSVTIPLGELDSEAG